jgi:regulator of sigma E protease
MNSVFSDYAIFVFLPLVIAFIIFIHEIGHYFAARFFGLSISEVSIGAGRQIWTRTDKHGTRWIVRAIPVWAHVLVHGFYDPAQKAWKKFLTVLAGPAANLLLPFFLYVGFFVIAGQPSAQPIVSGVEIGMPGDKAGIRPGDRVVAVNGTPVQRFQEIDTLAYTEGKTSVFDVERSGKKIKFTVEPLLYGYTDTDNIKRSYPRLGLLWRHKPFKLEAIYTVNGIDTKDNEDKARDLLRRNFGKNPIIGLDSSDGKIHYYRVALQEKSNPDLLNKGHRDYDRIFLGSARDDFYLRLPLTENIAEGAQRTLQFIRHLATVPFQLLPIDGDLLALDPAVYGEETWLANNLYRLMHLAVVTSILLGLFNLLPLPRIDGSMLVFYGAESLTGKPLSSRTKVKLLTAVIFIAYFAILYANLDNVPGYIDSRGKKLQEFIDKNDSGTAEKDSSP